MADTIERVLNDTVEQFVPKIDHNNDTRRRKSLWMNQNAIRKVRRKHHAWIRFLNTKDSSDYLSYVKARNEASHATRKARREFESRLVKEVKGNHKVFWNYVNRRRKSKKGIFDLRNELGECISDDRDKANVLNKHYSKVFTEEDMSSLPTIIQKHQESRLEVSVTAERVHAKQSIEGGQVARPRPAAPTCSARTG